MIPYQDIIVHDDLTVYFIESNCVYAAWNGPNTAGEITITTIQAAIRMLNAGERVRAKDLLPKATLLGAVGAALLGTFGGA